MDSERRQAQVEQVQRTDGIFVALDQSKGTTPKMLRLYGINVWDYQGEEEMLECAHELRERLITSPAFAAAPVLGAVLAEDTLQHPIDGQPAAEYLWNRQGVVPFLKVDRGLEPERDGAQLMRPIPDLDDLLDRAVDAGIFGIKTRSLVRRPIPTGIRAAVEQQLDVAAAAWERGLVPVLELEVSALNPEKAACEQILRDVLLEALDSFGAGEQVVLRLAAPYEDNFYRRLAKHPKTLRIISLGGGLTQAQACQSCTRNLDMAACLCRSFLEGLHVNQQQEHFDRVLEQTCRAMLEASLGLRVTFSDSDSCSSFSDVDEMQPRCVRMLSKASTASTGPPTPLLGCCEGLPLGLRKDVDDLDDFRLWGRQLSAGSVGSWLAPGEVGGS